MEGPKAVNAYQNKIVEELTILVMNINNMYQVDSGKIFHCTKLPVCIVAAGIVHNTRQCIDELKQLALDQNNYQSATHTHVHSHTHTHTHRGIE